MYYILKDVYELHYYVPEDPSIQTWNTFGQAAELPLLFDCRRSFIGPT